MSDGGQDSTVKIPAAEPVMLETLADYQEGAVVSREIMKNHAGTVTVFAFDSGQGLSEHTAPFDAMVLVLDGEAEIIIAGKRITTRAGETVVMPRNVPHALEAKKRFKMLLVMLKG